MIEDSNLMNHKIEDQISFVLLFEQFLSGKFNSDNLW